MSEESQTKTLYHYTDFNAMRGIIANGEIWLWNLRRMNDSQEMQYFIKELKIAAQKRLSTGEQDRMERLFNENLKDFDKISSFAACFSEYSDDAAQWSRYAKNGRGVCIAFNKELLAKIGEAGRAPLCKVNYSQSCDDMEIVEELCQLVKDNSAEKPARDPKKTSAFFNRLVASSPLFKHPSFISEKEYRLVSTPGKENEYLGEPSFFVEETNIKKYYALKLKKVCQSLVQNYSSLFEEIRIGPQATVPPSVLRDYFSSIGLPELAAKVKVSECPLRRF